MLSHYAEVGGFRRAVRRLGDRGWAADPSGCCDGGTGNDFPLKSTVDSHGCEGHVPNPTGCCPICFDPDTSVADAADGSTPDPNDAKAD